MNGFASGLHRIWKPRQTVRNGLLIKTNCRTGMCWVVDWKSCWFTCYELSAGFISTLVTKLWRMNIEFPSDHLISHISSNTPNRSISIYQNSDMAPRLGEIKQTKLIDLLFIPQPKCDLFCFIPARFRAKSEFW